MGFFKKATVAVIAVAAVGASTGIASADPSNDVNYEAKVVDKSIVTTIDAGAFKVSGDGKSVVLQDSKGSDLVSLPLAYNLGDLQFPFDRKISDDGKTLTLTPITDSAKATPKPETENKVDEWKPVASPEENDRALARFQSQIGLGTQVGSLLGTIVGAGVGCAVGAPLGLTIVGLPVAAALCLGGITMGAGIGGIAGTILGGGGAALVAGIDLVNTMNAPAGTTIWAAK
ncbi:ammonium transporter [Rhodococcus qingshengii]|uniref:ammonium transporter n=1 Tax=Rhodococcus qingshengii TaxID=334542 RepID=UPI0036DD90FD